MIKIFEFNFLDIYNKEYRISIYDSEGTTQGEIKTAKIYGQDGFVLNYKKDNIDIVQGGIVKSDVAFSIVNENGVLDNFLKDLQIYENRYLVDIIYNSNKLYWRGVMLNDYITFEDSKMQVIDFSCTDGLGLLQNIDYEDSIGKLDSTLMQFDSDAYGNGLIDVISRALSFNPVTNFFNFNERYINYRTDYIANEMLNDWDALVYTNILKHKADTTLLVSPFADYKIKETLAGNRLKVYEYKNCYDVINECLKVFNLCLCQVYGVWYIFNIRDFEKNKDNFILNSVNFADNSYYKNIRNKDLKESIINNYFSIGGNNSNKRGDGEFGLNTVVKKLEQKYVPYYVKEGTFNNLIYSGNHGGDLQWYSYPASVITAAQGGTLYYESNFDNWNLCSKYHYHNELDIFAAMTKLQFLINFYVTYAVNADGVINVPSMQCKLDLNLKVNGKWLDNNGNWVDNLPSDNWWHKFSGTFIGQDGVVKINFKKYFDLLIPSSNENLVVDFYFRIYSYGNLWVVDYIITDIENNSVLKLVDDNGNDIESIDYKVENDSGILDLEIEQAFIDNFGESEENNILFTAVQDLGLNSYRYKKSKKWKHTDEDNFYNLIELRLREIAAMNNHPLLRWDGNIYYDEDTEVNYMLFYLIKYNLTLQKYVMFANRWSFYARKKYAEASLIEVSKDFLKVVSGGELVSIDRVPIVQDVDYLNIIVSRENGELVLNSNSLRIGKGATNTIEIIDENNNKIGVIDFDKDNKTFIFKNTDAKGDLVELANMAEVSRYLKDSICRYDKYDYAIIECFLEDDTEIAFPNYTYFNGFKAFPANEIKNAVFRYIKFTGVFVMDNLEVANDYEFYRSVFTSDFNCPNLKTIGQYAFRYSQFTGSFNCPDLQAVGNEAFYYSQFTGDFECPNVTLVENDAFYYSQFTGDFECPNLQEVGNYAFRNSVFTGSFDCPNLQIVGNSAFENSQFTGEFNCPDLQTIGQYAFRNSVFNGSFNCPVCAEIGQDSFLNSTFTTITIGANANLGTGCIGAHSAEFINDYAANGKLAGTYEWDAGQNHWIYKG